MSDGRRAAKQRDARVRNEEACREDELGPLSCECGWLDCRSQLELTTAEYRRLVAAAPGAFLSVPHHAERPRDFDGVSGAVAVSGWAAASHV